MYIPVLGGTFVSSLLLNFKFDTALLEKKMQSKRSRLVCQKGVTSYFFTTKRQVHLQVVKLQSCSVTLLIWVFFFELPRMLDRVRVASKSLHSFANRPSSPFNSNEETRSPGNGIQPEYTLNAHTNCVGASIRNLPPQLYFDLKLPQTAMEVPQQVFVNTT